MNGIQNLPELKEKHDVFITTEIDGITAIIITSEKEVVELTKQLIKDDRDKLLFLKASTYNCIVQTRNKFRDEDIVLHYIANCLLDDEPIKLHRIK